MSDLDAIRALCPAAEWAAYPTKAEWLAAHVGGLGGSEAAVACGVSPWDTPLGLWARKQGLAPPVEETRAMRYGSRMEGFVADEYAAETGRTLLDPGRWTLMRNRLRPTLLGSVDRLILDDARGPGVLEIKTTGAHMAHRWDDGQVPPEVAIQVAHYLAALDLAWSSVAVLIGSTEMRWCDVTRDAGMEAELLAAEDAFLAAVASGDNPPLARAEDSAVLRLLYPRHEPGAVVALPGEAMDWDADILEAKAIIKAAEATKDAAENAIKQALGTAERGVCGNGVEYTWKASDRGGYVVEPSTIRTLRRVAPRR